VLPSLVERLRRIAPLNILVDEHPSPEAMENAYLEGLQDAEVLRGEV